MKTKAEVLGQDGAQYSWDLCYILLIKRMYSEAYTSKKSDCEQFKANSFSDTNANISLSR